jgi:hypothetical protein
MVHVWVSLGLNVVFCFVDYIVLAILLEEHRKVAIVIFG